MRGPFALAFTSLAAAVALCMQPAGAQQLYRWVDQNGRVTYSQNPPPPGAAKNVQQKRLGSSVVEGSDLPYAAQVAMKNFPVTLHTSPDCAAPCATARDALNKRGVPFKEIVAGDEESIAALRRLSGGTQVPVLQVGSDINKGYEPSAWNKALDQAGYPQSIPASVRRADPKVQRNLPAVRLFTSAQCGAPCQTARELLEGRSIRFQDINVDAESGAEELKKAGGSDILPVLTVGGSQSKGFEPQRYNNILDNAGFPPAKAAGK